MDLANAAILDLFITIIVVKIRRQVPCKDKEFTTRNSLGKPRIVKSSTFLHFPLNHNRLCSILRHSVARRWNL